MLKNEFDFQLNSKVAHMEDELQRSNETLDRKVRDAMTERDLQLNETKRRLIEAEERLEHEQREARN